MVAVSEEFQSRFTVCAGSRFSSQDFQNIDFELKFVLETNSTHYDALKNPGSSLGLSQGSYGLRQQ